MPEREKVDKNLAYAFHRRKCSDIVITSKEQAQKLLAKMPDEYAFLDSFNIKSEGLHDA